MNFAITTRAEVLKTKRTASFWLSLVGAAFIPAILCAVYIFNSDEMVGEIAKDPWENHITIGWQILSAFLLPMYIILISTLIPQIEFKNNSWKQVFASPQSYGNIYFSKFLTIHMMIVFFFLLFNFFMMLSAILANMANSDYTFFDNAVNWPQLLKFNAKVYVSILGITAIQYCLALRFKNFIAPMGIGLALLVGSIIAAGFKWTHVSKLPFAHPVLTFDLMDEKNRPFLENHEINSILFCVVFVVIGFLDIRFRKEKG